MTRRKKRTLLTKLELEVMRAIWDAGSQLTVREVVDRLNEGRTKPLAYNTVHTMLTILKDKGVVSSRRGQGRAYVYSPHISREEATTSMIGDLVDRLFDGQVQPLLLHLVEQEKLERDELEQLKMLIDTQLEDAEE